MEILKMNYPESYAPFHAGKWKDGEKPISDKYLMQIKHDSKNYLYVVDEFNRSDFLDWALQTFGPEGAFENYLENEGQGAFYNEFSNGRQLDIYDFLRLNQIRVVEIYLADLVKLTDVKIRRF
jgi:hypothetical protein